MRHLHSISAHALRATAIAAVGLSMFTSAAATAAPINYATGFEVADGFGVDAAVSSSPGANGWFREDGTPTSTTPPTIKTSAPAAFGAQSLNVINIATGANQLDPGSVSYAISPVSALVGPDVLATGNHLVHIEWYMRVDDPADTNDTSDTWALDVYDSSGLTRTLSVSRGIEDQGSGQMPNVYVTDGATGQYDPSSVGVAPGSGAWGKFEIDMNYVTRKWTVSLDNVLLAFNQDFFTGADNGLDVNFTVNGRGADSAYFDNFSVSVTPEPGVFGAVMVGAMAISRRRSR